MPRDHGRILVTIWSDPEFVALTPNAQRLYMLLVSQRTMNHAGLIPLQVNKWARCSQHTTASDVEDGLQELAVGHFAYFDIDTEEALVRSLIRNDGVLKQRNIFKNAMRCARAIESQYLRDAMALEIRKIDAPADRAEFDQTVNELDVDGVKERFEQAHARAIEPFRNPSGTPREDLPNPSDSPADSYPSRTLPEPLANPSGTLGGGGRGRGGGISTPTVKTSFKETSEILPIDNPKPVSTAAVPAKPERDDVTRLCEHLERRIIDNGCRKPKVNKSWRDAARLLIDKDNVDEADAHRLIDWCQDHHFWKSNILSFPKFREQYDKLRLQAEQGSRSTSFFGRPSMSDAVGLTVDRGSRLIAAATAQQNALRDESLTLALETPQTSIERPF